MIKFVLILFVFQSVYTQMPGDDVGCEDLIKMCPKCNIDCSKLGTGQSGTKPSTGDQSGSGANTGSGSGHGSGSGYGSGIGSGMGTGILSGLFPGLGFENAGDNNQVKDWFECVSKVEKPSEISKCKSSSNITTGVSYSSLVNNLLNDTLSQCVNMNGEVNKTCLEEAAKYGDKLGLKDSYDLVLKNVIDDKVTNMMKECAKNQNKMTECQKQAAQLYSGLRGNVDPDVAAVQTQRQLLISGIVDCVIINKTTFAVCKEAAKKQWGSLFKNDGDFNLALKQGIEQYLGEKYMNCYLGMSVDNTTMDYCGTQIYNLYLLLGGDPSEYEDDVRDAVNYLVGYKYKECISKYNDSDKCENSTKSILTIFGVDSKLFEIEKQKAADKSMSEKFYACVTNGTEREKCKDMAISLYGQFGGNGSTDVAFENGAHAALVDTFQTCTKNSSSIMACLKAAKDMYNMSGGSDFDDAIRKGKDVVEAKWDDLVNTVSTKYSMNPNDVLSQLPKEKRDVVVKSINKTEIFKSDRFVQAFINASQLPKDLLGNPQELWDNVMNSSFALKGVGDKVEKLVVSVMPPGDAANKFLQGLSQKDVKIITSVFTVDRYGLNDTYVSNSTFNFTVCIPNVTSKYAMYRITKDNETKNIVDEGGKIRPSMSKPGCYDITSIGTSSFFGAALPFQDAWWACALMALNNDNALKKCIANVNITNDNINLLVDAIIKDCADSGQVNRTQCLDKVKYILNKLGMDKYLDLITGQVSTKQIVEFLWSCSNVDKCKADAINLYVKYGGQRRDADLAVLNAYQQIVIWNMSNCYTLNYTSKVCRDKTLQALIQAGGNASQFDTLLVQGFKLYQGQKLLDCASKGDPKALQVCDAEAFKIFVFVIGGDMAAYNKLKQEIASNLAADARKSCISDKSEKECNDKAMDVFTTLGMKSADYKLASANAASNSLAQAFLACIQNGNNQSTCEAYAKDIFVKSGGAIEKFVKSWQEGARALLADALAACNGSEICRQTAMQLYKMVGGSDVDKAIALGKSVSNVDLSDIDDLLKTKYNLGSRTGDLRNIPTATLKDVIKAIDNSLVLLSDNRVQAMINVSDMPFDLMKNPQKLQLPSVNASFAFVNPGKLVKKIIAAIVYANASLSELGLNLTLPVNVTNWVTPIFSVDRFDDFGNFITNDTFSFITCSNITDPSRRIRVFRYPSNSTEGPRDVEKEGGKVIPVLGQKGCYNVTSIGTSAFVGADGTSCSGYSCPNGQTLMSNPETIACASTQCTDAECCYVPSSPSPSPSQNTSPSPTQGTSPSPSQNTSPSPTQGTSPSPSQNTSPTQGTSPSPSPSQNTSPSPTQTSSPILNSPSPSPSASSSSPSPSSIFTTSPSPSSSPSPSTPSTKNSASGFSVTLSALITALTWIIVYIY